MSLDDVLRSEEVPSDSKTTVGEVVVNEVGYMVELEISDNTLGEEVVSLIRVGCSENCPVELDVSVDDVRVSDVGKAGLLELLSGTDVRDEVSEVSMVLAAVAVLDG